jgi:hypothetical protein
MKKRMMAFLKWAGMGIVALAIVYAVLLGLANRKLRQAYAALEADGRPMRPEQVIPPAIPDSDNAALVYQAVVLQLRAEPGDDAKTSLFDRMQQQAMVVEQAEVSSNTLAAFRQLSQRKAVVDALQKLEVGSAKPGCRYDLDYNLGVDMPIKHIQDASDINHILRGLILLQAADGNIGAAWNAVLTALRMADAWKAEPLLISQLYRVGQIERITDVIRRLCDSAPPTSDQAAQLDELLRKFDDNTPLIRAIDGERIIYLEPLLAETDLARRLKTSHITPFVMWIFARVTISFQFDHAASLNMCHAAANSAGQGYSTADDARDATPYYCWMTRTLRPSFSAAKKRHIAMIAESRITRAGLAVLRYRAQQGHYPPDLAAVNMQNLVDPFTGKALIYRADTTGFTVYSAGPNQRDDNGVSDRYKGLDDIAWHFAEKKETTAPLQNQ